MKNKKRLKELEKQVKALKKIIKHDRITLIDKDDPNTKVIIVLEDSILKTLKQVTTIDTAPLIDTSLDSQ